MPEVRCVHFVKETDVRSSKDNLEKLREGCRFLKDDDKDIGQHENILIVDDVYSEGNIARVVIEKLKVAGLPSDSTITVACPLRVHHHEVTEAYLKTLNEGGEPPSP
jgi:hypoxanthine-guanine phosphoribosyltransferase